MRIQAISQMTRETATMAFCLPRLRAIRRYMAPRRVSVLAAVIAAWPSAPRRYRLPLPVRPGFADSPGLPGARGQARPGGGVRDGRQVLFDLLIQQGDLGVDRVDGPQVHRDLGGVDVAEPAGQRGLQPGGAGLEPVVAERGQRLRAALPGDEGAREPAPAGPEQIGD